jgi:hypothetical protein
MFEITVDSTAVEKTLATLTKNVADLQTEMPKELLDWQVEDMNRRKYTNVTMVDDMTAMTKIWPRGPETVQRRQEVQRRRRQRRLAAPTVIRKGVVVHQSKPILRPELFVKLCERMARMLQGVVPWA